MMGHETMGPGYRNIQPFSVGARPPTETEAEQQTSCLAVLFFVSAVFMVVSCHVVFFCISSWLCQLLCVVFHLSAFGPCLLVVVVSSFVFLCGHFSSLCLSFE